MTFSSCALVGFIAREPIPEKYDTLLLVELRRFYKDKHGETQQVRTLVSVRAVGQAAIESAQRLTTGDLVAITGELESRKNQDGTYRLVVLTTRSIVQLSSADDPKRAPMPYIKRPTPPAPPTPPKSVDEDTDNLDDSLPF